MFKIILPREVKVQVYHYIGMCFLFTRPGGPRKHFSKFRFLVSTFTEVRDVGMDAAVLRNVNLIRVVPVFVSLWSFLHAACLSEAQNPC